MEIRDREAKKEEVMKEMQSGPVLRDGQVIDYVPDLVAGWSQGYIQICTNFD